MSDPQEQVGRAAARREAAIAAMISSPTLQAAAKKTGISVATLRRWRKQPAFAAAYSEAKSELLEGTINALRGSGWRGVRVLRRIADDPKNPAAARVSAARAILETMLRGVELQDLEQRISKLEADAERKG